MAYRDSPTWDEVAHFTAGVHALRTGSFRVFCVNPPLVRTVGCILPVLLDDPILPLGALDSAKDLSDRAEFRAGRQTADLNGANFFWLVTLARWGAIPFTLIGGWVCFLWARELYGAHSGLLAQVLWTFEPNVLGHGHLITSDVPAASLGLAATYVFWRWLRQPMWRIAAMAGIALGVAQLTKTSLTMFLGLWPVLWLVYRWLSVRHTRLAWRREVLQVGLMMVIALWVVNLAYGFEASFKPLGDYAFVSKAFGGPNDPGGEFDVDGAKFRNRWRNTMVGAAPVPVPESFLLGIDLQRRDLEKTDLCYLRGEWKRGGWWYYYLYAMLVKCPVGLWVLIGLAAGVTLLPRRRVVPLRDEAVLLIPAVVMIVLVSSHLGFNRHLRYVLPAFPFLFVWASKVTRPAEPAPRWMPGTAIVACGGLVLSSLAVYPHSISYFNELSGGSANGYRHLNDSNTDWGQDLLNLRRWTEANPEARPLHLAYWMSLVDPLMAGIDVVPYPSKTAARRPSGPEAERFAPAAGWHVVSVNYLVQDRFALFRELEPADTIGYSLFVYHVTAEQAHRLSSPVPISDPKERR